MDRIPVQLQALASHSNILLLQGPNGPFFNALAHFLSSQGSTVTKVNFNLADHFFYPQSDALEFTGEAVQWHAWLDTQLTELRIDAVVVFGEWRFYHRQACDIAGAQNIHFFVFEEGYLRPNFITLEPHGVNHNSKLSRDPVFYQTQPIKPLLGVQPVKASHVTKIYFSAAYFILAYLSRWSRFQHYQHHREVHPILEGIKWFGSWLKKPYFQLKEKSFRQKLKMLERSKQFFLVPLQVHNDAQILYHSPYESIEDMIEEVMVSFAEQANSTDWLVFKHHPMDRAYRDYRRFIQHLNQRLGLTGRCFYIHEGRLPFLLKQAKGVVTVNSTVGLSAILHGTPTKTLGDALYDIPGLTAQQSLAEFWQSPATVDRSLFNHYRHYLVNNTQLNAGFYSPSSYHYIFNPL